MPSETSFALLVIASIVTVALMSSVRALAGGDNETAAAGRTLLGPGGVLRRAA